MEGARTRRLFDLQPDCPIYNRIVRSIPRINRCEVGAGRGGGGRGRGGGGERGRREKARRLFMRGCNCLYMFGPKKLAKRIALFSKVGVKRACQMRLWPASAVKALALFTRVFDAIERRNKALAAVERQLRRVRAANRAEEERLRAEAEAAAAEAAE